MKQLMTDISAALASIIIMGYAILILCQLASMIHPN